MDGINSDTSIKKTAPKVASKSMDSLNAGDQPISKSESNKVLNTNLSDITELSERIEKSSPANRPDAIARAKLLLADPNYLSDQNLDRLAGIINEVEKI